MSGDISIDWDAIHKILTPKQMEFILAESTKFNIADGSVRSGKTVCVMFKFMLEVLQCPGDQIWMIGHTKESVFHNCIRLVMNPAENSPLSLFAPFCTWEKSGVLNFRGKKIYTLGSKDERAIGSIQGKTMDLCYCNEMTLFPESCIQMIISRLSLPHSKLFADMNPVQPSHICHKWIEFAQKKDPKYYSLHFSIDDNTFLEESFKEGLRQSLHGLFYRRNYLGEWCLAEGAIFDFFDKNIHVVKRQKYADFWIAGVDYGASNAFACVILGVKEQKYGNDDAYMCAVAEYYYDPKEKKRTKTNSEYAQDLLALFSKFPIRCVYLDPSAASFRAELRSAGIHCNDTDNNVLDGITLMTSMVSTGQVTVWEGCKNLIREIEGYCWDSKESAKGWDEPLKKDDHAVDALRYAIKGYMGNRITLKQAGVGPGDPQFGRGLGQRK